LTIRPGDADDIPFLERMLFEAFFWSPALARPPFETFREQAEFTTLIGGWGRRGDRAVVAESKGTRHADTPELGLAVVGDYRRRGTARALLEALIATARTDGFAALSLSVNPLNPALALYESLGFRRVGESGQCWTLRLRL
jgi:ribosomal protein S18 acetylase RimI-like enzyme